MDMQIGTQLDTMMPTGLVKAASAAQEAKQSGDLLRAESAAKDFESVFMGQMLKPMWEGIETNSMFGGGIGEDAFRDMLVQEYGKMMTESDQLGISDQIMSEILRLQEVAAS